MYAVDIARDEAAAKLAPCEEADVSFLLTPYTDRKISIRLDRRMYSIKQEAEANWVWHAFRGFAKVEQQLAALGRSPQSFAAIGTGSGLDAIGAAHIFPSLRRIIVTDVEEPLARLAAANVRANVGDHIKVEALAGDVCLPLAESDLSVDVIYANLPNIPVGRDAAIIDHGTFYRPGEDGTGDALLDRYLLGLQHHFLRSAKRALRPEGVALLMIGGRFPYRIFDRLAAGAGFAFDEVLCYFKRQTEADNVVSGYAAAEAAGVEFDFYDFDAARATLRGGEQLSGRALKAAIEPWRLSAHAAQEHLRAGREIGHTLHLLKATPLSAA